MYLFRSVIDELHIKYWFNYRFNQTNKTYLKNNKKCSQCISVNEIFYI